MVLHRGDSGEPVMCERIGIYVRGNAEKDDSVRLVSKLHIPANHLPCNGAVDLAPQPLVGTVALVAWYEVKWDPSQALINKEQVVAIHRMVSRRTSLYVFPVSKPYVDII